jgi:hypothetical protein
MWGCGWGGGILNFSYKVVGDVFGSTAAHLQTSMCVKGLIRNPKAFVVRNGKLAMIRQLAKMKKIPEFLTNSAIVMPALCFFNLASEWLAQYKN